MRVVRCAPMGEFKRLPIGNTIQDAISEKIDTILPSGEEKCVTRMTNMNPSKGIMPVIPLRARRLSVSSDMMRLEIRISGTYWILSCSIEVITVLEGIL